MPQGEPLTSATDWGCKNYPLIQLNGLAPLPMVESECLPPLKSSLANVGQGFKAFVVGRVHLK